MENKELELELELEYEFILPSLAPRFRIPHPPSKKKLDPPLFRPLCTYRAVIIWCNI